MSKALTFTEASLAQAIGNVQCHSDLGAELIAQQVFADHSAQNLNMAERDDALRQVAILRQHKNDYMEAAEGTKKALEADLSASRLQIAMLSTCCGNVGKERDTLRAELAAIHAARGEVPEVVGYIAQQDIDWQGDCTLRKEPMHDCTIAVVTVAQHQRITAAMAAELAACKAQEPAAWRMWNGKTWRFCYSELHGKRGWEPLYALPPASQPSAVPGGWKLVPVEPTPTMMLHNSGCQHHAADDPDCPMRRTRRKIWAHMLESAPTP